MPLSKKRNRERMKRARAEERRRRAGSLSMKEIQVLALDERKPPLTPAERVKASIAHANRNGYNLVERTEGGKVMFSFASQVPDLSPLVFRLLNRVAALEEERTQHQADHVVWETGQRYTADDFSEP